MAKKKNYEYSNEELAKIARSHKDFKSPNFSLYVNDILGSNRVLMLSDSAYRGYINLLLAAWNEPDCGLPTTEPTTVDKLVKLSRVDRKTFEDNQDDILQFFFEYEGRFYNRRLLEERVKQIKRRQTNRDNVNKRYENTTNYLPENLQSYGFSYDVTDKENDKEKENESFKERGTGETKLDPPDERKSEYGGPAFKEVKEFFIANKRSADEALVFWNEYEGKHWFVIGKEDAPKRKMKTTKDWMLKAEQWIVKARKDELDKPKSNIQTKTENSTYEPVPGYKHKISPYCECGCGKPWTMRLREDEKSPYFRVASKECFQKCVSRNKSAFEQLADSMNAALTKTTKLSKTKQEVV